VTFLEQQMQERADLPARVAGVELQILQLRDEMRVEISATREGLRSGDDEAKRLARILDEDVLARIAVLGEGRG
jgi:hypothetical protein